MWISAKCFTVGTVSMLEGLVNSVQYQAQDLMRKQIRLNSCFNVETPCCF
jgi:hypothetical protein